MNRGGRRAAWLIVLACTPAAWAHAPASTTGVSRTNAADRAAVTRLEQQWLAAVEPGGDRKVLASILADDYLDTDWQGRTRDKAALIAASAAPGITQHVTGLRIRMWGDTAVATGTNHVHSTARGWTVEVPFTDVFARIDGRWRAVASQETLRKPAHALKGEPRSS